MTRPFRTFATIALGGATLAAASALGVAHAQVPQKPNTPSLIPFSVNLDVVNSAPQFVYNGAGAQVYLRLTSVNVYEQNQVQLLPGSEFTVFGDVLPRNLPRGHYTLTVNAMPGPSGVTFTAYNPVGNLAFQNGSTVASCSLAPGDFKTLRSCTMSIPMSPFVANALDVNVTTNNGAWLRNMTLSYALSL